MFGWNTQPQNQPYNNALLRENTEQIHRTHINNLIQNVYAAQTQKEL